MWSYSRALRTHLTPAAAAANVVLPGSAPISANGSYINTERRFQMTSPALKPAVLFNNWQLMCELAETLEMELPYDSEGGYYAGDEHRASVVPRRF